MIAVAPTRTKQMIPFCTLVLQLFDTPVHVEMHGHRKVYSLSDIKRVLQIDDEQVFLVKRKGEEAATFFILKEASRALKKDGEPRMMWFADELAVAELCLIGESLYSDALKTWAQQHYDDISERVAAAIIADTDMETGELKYVS